MAQVDSEDAFEFPVADHECHPRAKGASSDHGQSLTEKKVREPNGGSILNHWSLLRITDVIH